MTASITTLLLLETADFLNALNQSDELPKTIIYSLNPNRQPGNRHVLGCFRIPLQSQKSSRVPVTWWFQSIHKTGMQDQMISLANLGNLSGFVGVADRLQQLLILDPSRLLPQNSAI